MRKLNLPETVQQLTLFVQNTVRQAGFSQVVVALSGGVDSATALALAANALSPERVHALLLPYKDWHEQAGGRARLLMQQAQVQPVNIHEVNIAPAVDAFLGSLQITQEAESEAERLRAGNIMARTRMIVLFDLARKLECLVLGTENKSEHYLGYYTRFGDEASDIEPLRNLYKTEVYQVALELGIPQEILEAAPTAGLWPGQTDEGQFGFSYREADEILYGLYDVGMDVKGLVERGLNRRTVEAVRDWVENVDFKHHLPYLAPEPVVLHR